MSGGMRHTEPVDVHLILRRETGGGPEVLLSRRAGPVYASGLWHVPSGHLDGPHEDIVTALVREAREETGVVIDPADVHAALTMHHRSPAGSARTGYFFEVRRWTGEPQITEPDRCDAMEWTRLKHLPAGMVAYCRAGLDAYLAGARAAIHFQLPGDAIAHDPDADRLRLLPDTDNPVIAGHPAGSVVQFTERAVGRITAWEDVSWARENSCVWRAQGPHGGTWYVKVHQNDKFHAREVRAYRTWAGSLGAAAPRLVAADEQLRAVVVTAVAGRLLHGAALNPAEEGEVFARLGALARRIHQSAPPQPAPGGAVPAVAKAERHIAAARAHLAPGDEEFLHRLTQRGKALRPLPWVETHGDLQLRNVLLRGDGSLALIDFERSEPGPAIRDLVRLSDAWAGRPDLYEAFLKGYGRRLSPLEEEHLVVGAALDAVSGMAFGTAHGDHELVERGRRTLARLRAHDCPQHTGTSTSRIHEPGDAFQPPGDFAQQAAAFLDAIRNSDMERAWHIEDQLVSHLAADREDEETLRAEVRAELCFRGACDAAVAGDEVAWKLCLVLLSTTCPDHVAKKTVATALLRAGCEDGELPAESHDQLCRLAREAALSEQMQARIAAIRRASSKGSQGLAQTSAPAGRDGWREE